MQREEKKQSPPAGKIGVTLQELSSQMSRVKKKLMFYVPGSRSVWDEL
jgi:hypothetical protein